MQINDYHQSISNGGFSSSHKDANNPSINKHEIFYGEVIEVCDGKPSSLNKVRPPEDEVSPTNDYGIGSIKFRMLYYQNSRPEEFLLVANPINKNNIRYPLKGEVVQIFYIVDTYYYGEIVSINKEINGNTVSDISDNINIKADAEKIEKYKKLETIGIPIDRIDIKEDPLPFADFVYDKPGAHIIQSRYNNSIMLTYNSGYSEGCVKINNINSSESPSLGISRSSVWLTEGNIDFIPATYNKKWYFNKLKRIDKFFGSQITISSDRININSKQNEVLIFSNTDVYLNSNRHLIFECGDSANLSSEKRINILSQDIKIGSGVPDQSAVLGDELVSILKDLCKAISQITVIVGPSKSSIPVNALDFAKLAIRMDRILSKYVKIN